jgi:hypothetical protein
MRTYLNNTGFAGPSDPTHVAVIGTAADQAGATDFSAAASSQTYTLFTLKPGDVVFPGTIVDLITPIAGAAATYKFQVGISGGTLNQFCGAASNGDDLKSTTQKSFVGTIVSTPDQTACYVNTGSTDQTIVGTLTAATGNVAGISAGQLQVNMRISSRTARVRAQV